jgi:hypothetical protein
MGKEKRNIRGKTSKKLRKNSWMPSEVGLLKRLFADQPTARLAKKLGRKVDAVKKKASRMGLKKSKRYMKTLGRA